MLQVRTTQPGVAPATRPVGALPANCAAYRAAARRWAAAARELLRTMQGDDAAEVAALTAALEGCWHAEAARRPPVAAVSFAQIWLAHTGVDGRRLLRSRSVDEKLGLREA